MRQREFLKGVCILLIFVCSVAASCTWPAERPSTAMLVLHFCFIAGAVIGLVGFLVVHFRRDKAPDYLHDLFPEYFDRDGFCFSVVCDVEGNKAVAEMYYQNRHDRQCEAQVAMRPRRGFLAKRDAFGFAFRVNCPPGGFGVVRMPMSLPSNVQGKVVTFEVGARAYYPNGRGNTLRFRDGTVLRRDSDLSDSYIATLRIARLLGGSPVLPSPASITLQLPDGVLEELPAGDLAQDLTLWQLGDPPL